jgi:hypothetical protein
MKVKIKRGVGIAVLMLLSIEIWQKTAHLSSNRAGNAAGKKTVGMVNRAENHPATPGFSGTPKNLSQAEPAAPNQAADRPANTPRAALVAPKQAQPDGPKDIKSANQESPGSVIAVSHRTKAQSFDYSPNETNPEASALLFWSDYASLRSEEMSRRDSAYVQDAFRQLAEKRRQRLAAASAAQTR